MSFYRERWLNDLDFDLRALCDEDGKWNQIVNEESHQEEGAKRLDKEMRELEKTLSDASTGDDRIRIQQDLEIVQAKWSIAELKKNVAFCQRRQREYELRKSLLEGDHMLAEIEANIKVYQESEQKWEEMTNQNYEVLNKLMSKIKDEDPDKIVIPPLTESISESHSTPSSVGQVYASISASSSAQMPIDVASDSHLSPYIKSAASKLTAPTTGSASDVASVNHTAISTPASASSFSQQLLSSSSSPVSAPFVPHISDSTTVLSTPGFHPSTTLDAEGQQCASVPAEANTDISTDCLGANDLVNVLKAAWQARVDWYNIGLTLRITPDTLDVIKKENHHVINDCFREMLKTWLNNVPPPTWTELIKALKSRIVGHQELAEEIAHHLRFD